MCLCDYSNDRNHSDKSAALYLFINAAIRNLFYFILFHLWKIRHICEQTIAFSQKWRHVCQWLQSLLFPILCVSFKLWTLNVDSSKQHSIAQIPCSIPCTLSNGCGKSLSLDFIYSRSSSLRFISFHIKLCANGFCANEFRKNVYNNFWLWPCENVNRTISS